MTWNIFSRSSLLLAALVLSACGSTVRLGEVPIEDRGGAMANRAGGPGQAAGGGSSAGSAPGSAVGSGPASAAAPAPAANRVVIPVDLTSRSAAGPVGGAPGQGGSGAAGGAGAGGSQMAAVPANLRQGNVIRFAFDSFEIAPEYQTLVDAHARFLSANPARKVMVAGHADERGGREYNLALGQKRAEAVRQRLTFLGVPDRQIEAVSFGEEKPVATGGGEDAFAQNRRAEISYP